MGMISPHCPKCGQGKLFASLLKTVDACESCGLKIGGHDAADGPAFFAIIVVGFAVMIAMGLTEYHYAPPFWVHAALWVPLTFVLCIWLLRLFKAWMIAWELKTGRLEKKDAA